MICLQITANTGPAECCLAVRKALDRLLQEAQKMNVEVTMLEQVDGPLNNTLRSVFLGLESNTPNVAEQLAQEWSGSICWNCVSPYRPAHKRKNWFIGGAIYFSAQAVPESEIKYEATRASGPGGQHVNKTDSAIRATHIASGLSVKVQTERSQHANKRLAAQLLASKLAALAQELENNCKAERHMQHLQTERGNAHRIFAGINFKEQVNMH